MTNDLFQQVKDELRHRTQWEERQATWYKMRYSGLKRAAPPYKGAPDMHYPLTDSMIEKLKPFYISQIYGQQLLCAFRSQTPQAEELTSLSERLFDHVVKQDTNFERAIFTSIDHMLMYGRGPLKIYWDAQEQKVCFANVRPIHLIVPWWTEDLKKADWLVHVIQMSEAEYRRGPHFKKDEAFIKAIRGRGHLESDSSGQEADIMAREGIVVGEDDHQIIVWEVYWRDKKGNVMVSTISPIVGVEEPIRPTFGLPYIHGEIPFVDTRYELSDTDYYSSRGVVEILAQFELDLCKRWNHKLQFLDFFGQPQYKNTGSTPVNTGNYASKPGATLPPGVEPIFPSGAPMDFKDEMEFLRAIAEDRISTPDLSAGEHLSGNRGSKGGITATQINALLGQSSANNTMRSRIFRLQLGNIYRQAWSLICQYLPENRRVLDDFTQVPRQAMHRNYRLEPSGSADSYSKEQRLAKAIAFKQMFNGSPNIKQSELDKWVLEQENSSLVDRLYQDPGDAQQDEAERQAEEIVLILNEWPAKVRPGDDDKVHLVTIIQWVEHRIQSGQPIPPKVAQLLYGHATGHAQQIKTKRDKEGMALLRKIAPIVSQLQAMVAQPMAQAQMPQAPIGAGPVTQPQGGNNADKPSSLGNMLASLMKAGAPITLDDINGVLAKAGLPPIPPHAPLAQQQQLPPGPAPLT